MRPAGSFSTRDMDDTTTKHDAQPEIETRDDAPTADPIPGSDEASDLQRQRDEYYDLLLRKTAEFDNYRKRVERERQTLADATAASVVEELLPLMDDLERALEADPGSEGAEAYRRGVELIHRQLGDVLRKRGVVAIEAVGADFDPHVHQAVAYEPAEGRREGEVGERLLRPSMVRVAKG
jgi:molecular chaperone GrpE